jgi:DNA invertase Pin-like site-specific DNA recombinase
VFNAMLDRIEAGEAEGIIAWHPDRLARNMVDGGRIIHLIDTGKLKDLRFANSHFENTPQGKLNLAIQFTFSKYYVDELSENIRRGMRTRASHGWAPGRVPLGYVSNKETSPREILPDPERFQLVERMWRLLLTGTYSITQIHDIATLQWGLRTPRKKKSGGGPMSTSGLYALFSRPFYAGVFTYEKKLRIGKHRPMITLDEFEQAQAILGRQIRPRRSRRQFTFTGLMRCGCGLAITAEEKINRYGTHYVYYHCTRRHADGYCREPYVQAPDLTGQIARAIDLIVLNPRAKDWLLDRLERFEAGKMAERDAQTASLNRGIATTEAELRTLTQLRLREMITDDDFVRERTSLEQMRLTLIQRRDAMAESRGWIEPAREVIEFSNRAADYFQGARPHIQRLIVETVGSNPMLVAKTFSMEAKKPFQRWAPRPSVSSMCTFLEALRTSYQSRGPAYLGVLANVRRIEAAMKEPEDGTLLPDAQPDLIRLSEFLARKPRRRKPPRSRFSPPRA